MTNASPTMNVTPIEKAYEAPKRPRGRPPKPQMPSLPDEIMSAMSGLEKEHFLFFRDSYEELYERKYHKLTPTARITILQAAFDYVHLLRMQTEQMQSGKLVSMARQHPGVQIRAWLLAAGLQEKDLNEVPTEETSKEAVKAALLQLSGS